MIHHYSGCGGCSRCRTGWAQLCQEGITVYGVNGHGAHEPCMKVPASTLVDLPDELNFETGAAIFCGTGTAYYALRRSNLSCRDTVAIFGQGPVGLSATQLAKASLLELSCCRKSCQEGCEPLPSWCRSAAQCDRQNVASRRAVDELDPVFAAGRFQRSRVKFRAVVAMQDRRQSRDRPWMLNATLL
jgi:hypothetical protein